MLCLGARQQHAILERVEESRLVNPPLLLDHDAMEHCDLPGRSAKAEQAHAPPHAHRLGERRRRNGGRFVRERRQWESLRNSAEAQLLRALVNQIGRGGVFEGDARRVEQKKHLDAAGYSSIQLIT